MLNSMLFSQVYAAWVVASGYFVGCWVGGGFWRRSYVEACDSDRDIDNNPACDNYPNANNT
jgi:hypothetical protein